MFSGRGGEAHLSGILQREFQKMVPDNQQLCVFVCVSVVCVCVVVGGGGGRCKWVRTPNLL